jgi:hypothetical protein
MIYTNVSFVGSTALGFKKKYRKVDEICHHEWLRVQQESMTSHRAAPTGK